LNFNFLKHIKITKLHLKAKKSLNSVQGIVLYFHYVFMVIIKLIEGPLIFFNKYKYYFKNWLTRALLILWNVSTLFKRRVWRPNGGLWGSVQIVSVTSHDRTTCMTYWPLIVDDLFFTFFSFFLDFHTWPSKILKHPFNLFMFRIWSILFLLLFVLFKKNYFFLISSLFNFFIYHM